MSGARLAAGEAIGGHRPDPDAPLLAVEDLAVQFNTAGGVVHAVNGMSYRLREGETVAILGESGAGKSVSAHAVMGILDTPPAAVTRGRVRFRGVDLLGLSAGDRRKVRGNRIAMVFQDAMTALNPVFTVGRQIGEMFRRHRGTPRREARRRAVGLMERVGIPGAAERIDVYPHELSGGMRQRVMIAMALALDPEVLIADEPTTALDVTVQAQILELLAELQEQTGMGMVLITHDLGVVAEVADHVNVMYAGRIVEAGPSTAIYQRPGHPYTLGLLGSIPRADISEQVLDPIDGHPPDLSRIPSGCPFHPRCSFVRDRCRWDEPPAYDIGRADRLSACHYHAEVLDEQD